MMKKRLTLMLLTTLLCYSFSSMLFAESDGHDKKKEEKHGDHEEKGAHKEEKGGHKEEKEGVKLDAKELKEFGVKIQEARGGKLNIYTNLPGEIVLNADKLAHVVPRISGIVREVYKKIGDNVKKNDILAVIDSRELADAKAEYLANKERLELAQAILKRELGLWKKKISSEQEYLDAKQRNAEVNINLRSSRYKLYALGLTQKDLEKISGESAGKFTRYEIKAPFAGAIITKHISLGEAVESNSDIFTVADLNTVWVDLSVYPKDLANIATGQNVVIHLGRNSNPVKGKISYVGPILGESTRTALARIVLENKDSKFKPGTFITSQVEVSNEQVDVIIPKGALQTVEGKLSVFVQEGDTFEARAVKIGRSNDNEVEVLSGLKAGERYVYKNSFTLKSQILKSSFSGGHSH